ncbi:hypothetical protein PERMA_1032 [Persephonella marina EX-H1]|uniref:Uncharacterized protein n=1 Tax=Persephonella marina (strain DSM 14350 / EX-H1) TaxID=123214 RepID=C0QQ72_PERMH|nr:hypothetical protein PERMA_1032 [Persephonella marina EX-H1]
MIPLRVVTAFYRFFGNDLKIKLNIASVDLCQKILQCKNFLQFLKFKLVRLNGW